MAMNEFEEIALFVELCQSVARSEKGAGALRTAMERFRETGSEVHQAELQQILRESDLYEPQQLREALKVGSLTAYQQLRDVYGLALAQLALAGATLGPQRELLLRTRDELAAAYQAVLRVLLDRYGASGDREN